MNQMIAYCGLVCTDCAAYKATQANDQAALEKVAAEWREQFNPGITRGRRMQRLPGDQPAPVQPLRRVPHPRVWRGTRRGQLRALHRLRRLRETGAILQLCAGFARCTGEATEAGRGVSKRVRPPKGGLTGFRLLRKLPQILDRYSPRQP